MQTVAYKNYYSEEFRYNYENLIDFNTSYPTQTHTGWEFLFVKNGALSYSADGNIFDIGPGSLIITRPGEIHTLSPKGLIHYERYCLIVAEKLLFKDLIEQLPPDLHILDISKNKNILNLFEKFNYYLSNLQGEQLETMLRMLINELWMDIYIAAQTPSQPVATQSNAFVTKATNFVKEHIREPLTVQNICSTLFISPSYLHYCFTKYLNVTPKQYIMLQKLQMAQQALINAENPTKVCREFGFRNYSTFYRNYQKIYGCRPSDSPQQSLQEIEL